MKSVKMLMMLLVVCQLSLSVYGCGAPKERSGDAKIVARINSYDMTVEDFRGAAKAIGGTKERVLEELLIRNVLIQEAQKQNFDKDKAFMKEIERYWEQALLKLLIKQKTAEFSEAFKGNKSEVEAAMGKWVKDLRDRANIKINKENFDDIKIP